jgi:hypothetical protein
LAHVLWVVYRHWIVFLRTRKPACEIPFGGGTPAARISDFATPGSAPVLGCSAAAASGFLAGASSVHERGSLAFLHNIPRMKVRRPYRLSRSDFGSGNEPHKPGSGLD